MTLECSAVAINLPAPTPPRRHLPRAPRAIPNIPNLRKYPAFIAAERPSTSFRRLARGENKRRESKSEAVKRAGTRDAAATRSCVAIESVEGGLPLRRGTTIHSPR